MANAIKMLQDDHNSVRMLFGQFHQIPSGQGDIAEKTARQIASMLITHDALEEHFIYPVLAEYAPELAKESVDEHEHVKKILSDLEGVESGTDSGLSELLTQLQAAVQAHVEKEEENVFPLLSDKLGVEQLEDIGHRMMGRQQELLQENADTTSAASAGRPQITTPRI